MWNLEAQDLELNIVHIPEASGVVEDALSRLQLGLPMAWNVNHLSLISPNLTSISPSEWTEGQEGDVSLIPYFNVLEHGEESQDGVKGTLGIRKYYTIRTKMLMKGDFHHVK